MAKALRSLTSPNQNHPKSEQKKVWFWDVVQYYEFGFQAPTVFRFCCHLFWIKAAIFSCFQAKTGHYVITLLICSLVHELGHAVTAVSEDVTVIGSGTERI